MVVKQFGCAGVMVGGVSGEKWVPAARDDGFLSSTMSLMSGEGGKGRQLQMIPQSSPALPMGVGRNVQKFIGDLAYTGGEMRLPWLDRCGFVVN
jgi:hypothetical protein